jgi:hypothetical protein
MPIILEDSNGVLWTVWVDVLGELRATPGASGTVVGVYLNDSSGASWQLTITTTGEFETVPSGTRDYPTTVLVDPWWLLTVVEEEIVTFPSAKLRLWQQTVISQYANSPTLLALIRNFNSAIDPSLDIDNFYAWIWNVATAQGFGLDIWGRIVGVSRTIPTSPATILTDTQFREFILLKALSNISVATSPAINILLQNWMAGRGRCYVNDLGNMEIRYMFEFPLEPFEIDIITETGVFLRPAGVGGWVVTTNIPVFGFKEMGATWAAPFNQEPFLQAGQPYAVS